MKTLLIILLPLLTFAQSQFLPDTLTLLSGENVPSLITSIEGERINFNYSDNRSNFIVLPALKKVTLENFGTILSDGKWANIDLDKVKDFINSRYDKINALKKANNEQKNKISNLKIEKPKPDQKIAETQFKKWSFGVLLIPYYSSESYDIMRSGDYPPYPTIYKTSKNEINMEAQISYGIIKNLRLTFDASYTSSFSETTYDSHQRNTGYTYDYGYKNTDGLKLFDFNFGLKYYINDFLSSKVNIFVLAAVGKQIAFVQNSRKDLYPDTTSVSIVEDNIEKFTKDLNSPWHLNFGFGAEYFFNESLSLVSSIRVFYSSTSGKYESRYIYNEQTSTVSDEETYKDFSTKIGIGLNYYF